MPTLSPEPNPLRIGVDVGGTFTDLVCFDPATGELRVVKLPSTPPEFHLAVIEAVARVLKPRQTAQIVHGSTVATNALLQRSGEPCAFVTTEGFRDMLLIGRQNRPQLYALNVVRPRPLTAEENWFTVRERIDSSGQFVEPLHEQDVDELIAQIQERGLRHVAVCLLFSFINPAHEQLIGRRCREAGLTVSLSSEVHPEFREYERASTTVINASLRPPVQSYLEALQSGLGGCELRIMHSGGGTVSADEAARSAARLVLSGPAGGVIGAAYVGAAVGLNDLITYDMGGTSTDVATIVDGQVQWTTAGTVDGLPLGVAAIDIHTVGAGGGSIAYLDTGGALRVGPCSAGAVPGPACYARGGAEPTVTDANVVLGRIIPDFFAGGSMRIDPTPAHTAIEALARAMVKDVIQTALGIVRVAENNMVRAIRAVTSRRGLDPRRFTLLSFGGAGGLHACALADSLEIPRVLVPPYCGVLSALGMVVAPPVADASRTVVHLADQLDDARIVAEYGSLSGQTMDVIGYSNSASVEAWADVRFRGQSHELKVRVDRPSRDHINQRFVEAYASQYGTAPTDRPIEIVTLRVRRYGNRPPVALPPKPPGLPFTTCQAHAIDETGRATRLSVVSRSKLTLSPTAGPLLIIDAEATIFVPGEWSASLAEHGAVLLERG